MTNIKQKEPKKVMIDDSALDIVYVYKSSEGSQAGELRYSLRSLSNIPHRRVFIVGDFPEWAENCTHIPVEQHGFDGDSYRIKHTNVSRSLQAACADPRISDDFILMNDDFFIMSPIGLDDLNRHWGSIDVVIDRYASWYGKKSSQYISSMIQAKNMLNNGLPGEKYSFELHIPIVVNKTRYLELLNDHKDQFDENPALLSQWRTIYGNRFYTGSKYMDDVKVFNDEARNEYYSLDDSGAFLSGTGAAFNDGELGERVRLRFDSRSKYEA